MNTLFPKLPKNPTQTGFREMQIYELVRQAADAWNIPLEQVALFQEWWDNGRSEELARNILHEYQLFASIEHEKNLEHRFSQFYKQHTSYALPEEKNNPHVANLIDIADYYLINPTITVPNFVITIDSENLYDIAELGESVLVLTSEKSNSGRQERIRPKHKKNKSFLLEYLKKIQVLVEEMQIVSSKSLPDLYVSNSITFKFSVDIPVKCRNLILAQKVKIKGIRFMPSQMQVMGGI
jgi:hypothetical protein